MSQATRLSDTADARFRELRATDCHSAVCAELERIVREDDDLACYKLNVMRIARVCEVDVQAALRTFLFATQLGILDLNYDVYCPSCRGNTEYAKHLMGLQSEGHCNLCTIDFGLDFLEQVEVTFTVNGNVRAIDVTDFDERDQDGKVAYFQEVVQREGRRPTAAGWFEPGERRALSADLDHPEGYVLYLASHHRKAASITVVGERTADVQRFEVVVGEGGEIVPRDIRCRPGPVEVYVSYRFGERWPMLIMPRGYPNNWLSAAFVTSQQDFRDLFAGEFLAPGVSFAIRNATFMFTDIKQSTEMFEELGDSAAYALVQDHFSVMADIIRTRQGGIVKTIGDAVMAAFPGNRDAVEAACDIQRAFMQEPIKNRFIQVKIGLHRGPSIAVTSNRNLDYFGRTVNIAARVQGKSAAHQVLMSTTVMDDPQVADALARRSVTMSSFTTELKGIGDGFQLYVLDRADANSSASGS